MVEGALKRTVGLIALTLVGIAVGILWQQLPGIGAGGLLHPARRAVTAAPPEGCVKAEFAGSSVTLRGWTCTPSAPVRATIVYLHGVADNRQSAASVVRR